MKGRSLLAFTALAVALACDSDKHPTGISEIRSGRSSVLSDGANGGNPDFFFLPPLVKKPKHDPNFELGKFNNALQPSLSVEICALESTNGLPEPTTQCDGGPVKMFDPGSVQLVNLPGSKPSVPKGFNPESWWKGHERADGFYYVLWDTRQPPLNPDRYYRINVLVEGSDTPLGYVDVDLKAKGRKWQHSRTGDVIEMIDGVMLPIPFRVEKGAFCDDGSACNSATIIDNDDPNAPDQIVTVEGADGPIGGAAFPSNFLPEDGPQRIVVTISRVNTQGGEGTLCHPSLRMQQFEGCFKFETIPELETIGESDDQFARFVRVAVCFELDGTNDPRKEFVQLWASDAGKAPRRLPEASDEGILEGSGSARNCSELPLVGSSSSSGVLRLASAAWHKIQSGFGRAFGVKTAYAVDKGLGGLVKGFSNISPVLSTEITRSEETQLEVEPGTTITATVRIIGSTHHDEEEGGEHGAPSGIGGQPVTFSLGTSDGLLRLVESQGAGVKSISMLSGSGSVESEEPAGFAQVSWTVPEQVGTYRVLATGGGPSDTVSFTVTVAAPDVGFLNLGTLPGDVISAAMDINTSGHIVGRSTGENETRPFIWVNGVMTALGSLGGIYGEASAINSAGEVVGFSQIASGPFRAFRWKDGVMTNLGTLGETDDSRAVGINSAGHVVGYSESPGRPIRGWIWQAGVMTELGLLPGGTFVQPFAINDAGQVTGSADSEAGHRAFVWQSGQMTVLGTLAGGTTTGRDINLGGKVVGESYVTNSFPHAFAWADGTITDLTPGLSGGETFSIGSAISSDGRVVGYRYNGVQYLPVLWQGQSMIDLVTLGGGVSEALGINSFGQIVGYSTTTDGWSRAVRWQAPPLQEIP